MTRVSLTYNLLSSTGAFLLWGGWAYYINAFTSHAKGLASGAAQGVSSFFGTMVMVYCLTAIYNKLPLSDKLKMALSSLMTVFGVAVALTLIHTTVGTPRVIITILPSLVAATLFCLVTTYKLKITKL